MSMTGPAAVIVLAAGEGTRMKSSTPKVLNEVCGRTMLGHALAAARELRPAQLIAVISEAGGPVASYLAEYAPDVLRVVQAPPGRDGPRGPHRARDALGVIGGTVVVTYGDTPLLRGRTLGGLVAAHEAAGAAVTALVARAPTRRATAGSSAVPTARSTARGRARRRHRRAAGHRRDQHRHVRL